MKKFNLLQILLLAALPLLYCELSNGQTTYFMTNTLDAGAGSLRQAILDANGNTGADGIEFNIPGSDPNYDPAAGVYIIIPGADLPESMYPVTVVTCTSSSYCKALTIKFIHSKTGV